MDSTDIRALDAEKKALVYDNYSKLITATETIRKMRTNMDPLNPMATTLDPAISQIYERANAIKVDLKDTLSEVEQENAGKSAEEVERAKRRARAAEVARRVLDVPEQIRRLIKDGKQSEAQDMWQSTRRLLDKWQASGKGGEDVQSCIDDGEAALQGEPPNDKSWVNIKSKS